VTALTFRLELRRSVALTAWLGLIVVAYGAIMGLFYPIMVDNAAQIEDYMKLFPKEMMAAFGMTGSLADPGVFFSTYIGSLLWPVIAAIAAILTATRATAADVERGWLEMPLGTPLTRRQYLLASIGGQVVVMAVLALVTVVGVLAAAALVNVTFDAARFLAAGAVLFLFGAAIAGVCSLVAVVTLSRGIAAGVTSAILIAMYLANVIAQLSPDLAWVGNLSAFKHLMLADMIDTGAVDWVAVVIFTVVALGGWLLALALFRRRDLLA
jgi:ABC-type transport system involved in multi-copper enzyme maturation permease subunit